MFETFHTVYLLVRPPSLMPLWSRQTWKPIADALTPVVKAARGPAVVTSSQRLARTKQTVGFPRLTWSGESLQMWTIDAGLADDRPERRVFESMTCFAPGWDACAATMESPDVYVNLVARAGVVASEVLIVSVSDRLEPYAGQVPGALAHLARAAEAQVLWARTRRPFAFPFGRGMQRMMEELAYVEIPEAEAVPTLRTLDQVRETVDCRTRTIVQPWSAV